MKGETCTGPDCDRPQMVRFDLCQHHRAQQKQGKTLKPIERQGHEQPPCSFPGCEKPQRVRGVLCDGHRQQERLGRPLKTLRPVRKYGPDDTCGYEPCGRRPVSNGYCTTHNWQQKTWGELKTIGEREPVETGYSETRKCDTCKETKNWRVFVMGVENRKKKAECRDCYRKRILPPKEEKVSKPIDLDELFAGMDFN